MEGTPAEERAPMAEALEPEDEAEKEGATFNPGKCWRAKAVERSGWVSVLDGTPTEE